MLHAPRQQLHSRSIASTAAGREFDAGVDWLLGAVVPLALLHCARVEGQAHAVDAVPQPALVLRPVIEDVPQVCFARLAPDFRPRHATRPVVEVPNGAAFDGRSTTSRRIEGRPPAVRIELLLRREQLRAAAHALVRARVLVVCVLAGERALCMRRRWVRR